MKLTLRLLAPYLAVVVFWNILGNAWLAILAYHLQILFWSGDVISSIRRSDLRRIPRAALLPVLAGPLLYILMPHITHADLTAWLADHHLSRLSLALMIPYFGLVHPFLEQCHWRKLREQTHLAHPLFAGYHILVLYSLLTVPWLVVCFVVLMIASLMWRLMTEPSHNLTGPIASHVLADLGIVIAAWFRG
jgi:hypothetical protein